jgi:aryl-alcohol dehydrogenase-like predicted oxidoreductase
VGRRITVHAFQGRMSKAEMLCPQTGHQINRFSLNTVWPACQSFSWSGERLKACTSSQLALAWVLCHGEEIVPIPGTKRARYLDDNLGALAVHLTPKDPVQIDAILPVGAVSGLRYHAQAMQAVDR